MVDLRGSEPVKLRSHSYNKFKRSVAVENVDESRPSNLQKVREDYFDKNFKAGATTRPQTELNIPTDFTPGRPKSNSVGGMMSSYRANSDMANHKQPMEKKLIDI